MATTTELQKKLTDKLRELFQLDQPDLDFGFYRVMHAKQKEITDYLETKLPAAITAAFKDSGSGAIDALEAAYHASVAQAQSFGAPDPEATEPVKKAKKAWEDAKEVGNAHSDVYDHLYHFFERYYDHGDFVSLRYLTRETDKHAKPYAIPYAGEEVMLHWANADQYYIKTSENFSHFSVDITQHPVLLKMDAMERMTLGIPAEPLKLHFNIVDADEGEHGNVKAGKDRFFILHEDEPCAMKEDGLHVNFEYRADPDKQGTASKWQEELRKKAIVAVRAWIDGGRGATALPLMDAGTPVGSALRADRIPTYAKLLFYEYEVGEGREKQTILGSYLKRYMARNTADYFIHKDLGGFLRRELDFYIKNDLMILDDVAAATPETVAKWLGKTKAFRAVALDIIAFLAQLEDFQKKLWLKKKFVVQCDYCLTMDRVPHELKPEVLANAKQQAAWAALGTDVDPNSEDTTAIDARMVDTQYFDEAFKQKLLASVDDFDEKCDGVLVHSENFGALNTMRDRFGQQVKAIFIDPPYNTGEDGFSYKDAYRSSSWLSMMNDRVRLSSVWMSESGMLGCHMDEHEHKTLEFLLENIFKNAYLGPLVWDKRNPKGDVAGLAAQHEYIHFAARSKDYLSNHEDALIRDKENAEAMLAKAGALIEAANGVTGAVRNAFAEWLRGQDFTGGEKAYKYIDDNGEVYRPVSMAAPDKPETRCHTPLKHPVTNTDCPVPAKGWRYKWETLLSMLESGEILFGDDDTTQPQHKYLLKDNMTEMLPSVFYYGGSDDDRIKDLGLSFKNPKTVRSGCYFLRSIARPGESLVLDYFAGSGTTAHAVIDLNRQDADNGKRKYILIEMGDHFATVLKPRIQKVVYSPDWKDGKPETKVKGISHCFKYLRLESYEDTLNNLTVDASKGAAFAGVQDYFLKYMLDVETKESPSLLRMGEIANPFGCKLMVKKPASEEREERVVDLVETFNYLIGLRVKNTAAMRSYSAEFERVTDPELPSDGHTKLTIKGAIKKDAEGPWKFRTVEGWVPKNRFTPNDGAKERVLIVWRTLTDDREKDNAVLDYFLQHKEGVNPLAGDYDVIYVNGSNNVPNLKQDGDTWKVRLIEDDFQSRMWEGC